jgi:peptide/nickel transport system ATP-binding protein/oligopeptide transport system ATP-binding protein
MTAVSEPLLEVSGLEVEFDTEYGTVRAVDCVDFDLRAGEILALVGESGSGKSVTMMTLVGLTRGRHTRVAGQARFGGLDLVSASEEELTRVRGSEIALVFQDPMSAWHPVYRVGEQIAEQIRAHLRVSHSEAMTQAVDAMQRAGIPHAAARARCYPHELSGGLRQRAMIAMAMSCSPKLVIADEPTTALDVTVQAQILSEMRRLRAEEGISVILVAHDLAVVAQLADRVAVMYGGRVVEQATVGELFANPRHPYTWGLLECITRLDAAPRRRLATIAGTTPSLIDPPGGCHFQPRCQHRHDRCASVPPLTTTGGGDLSHVDRCWLTPGEKASRAPTSSSAPSASR